MMFEGAKTFWKQEWPFYRGRLEGKKYYIIRRPDLGAGFFSNYWWVMGHIVFAKKLGYRPVVDMENYKTLYSEEEAVQGERNAWNYYFEDVDGVSLAEAYDSGRYVLAQERPLHKYANKYCDPTYRFPSAKTIDYYGPVAGRYMKVRPQLAAEFDRKWKESVEENGKVLGVHVRGTDMRNNLGHPVPAAVETYMQQAGQILKTDREIRTVFLATDETEVTQAFAERFAGSGIRVFWNEAFRVKGEQDGAKRTGVHETKLQNPRKLHKYRMGLEVLNDAWFLAKCDALLCGYSNITNVALIWNAHRYEKVVCLGEANP